MLRDIVRGKDKQVQAALEVITSQSPDILVVWGIDWDLDGLGIGALTDALRDRGLDYPHVFAAKPNRGTPTGFDLDGNGTVGDAEDAQSYGEFTGQNSLAVLSRWPIETTSIRDYTAMLWRDLPGALLPWPGQPEGVEDILRLSSTAHWLVPIDIPDHGRAWIGTFSANTPVFDGDEDRNGRRNHDELMFWTHLLNGALDAPAPSGLVLAGHANLDPERGDGRREAIRTLLSHPTLQDPKPTGSAGKLTVDWKREDLENMRLSYVLPSTEWRVSGSGVFWPDPEHETFEIVETASRHRLVWVDLQRAD